MGIVESIIGGILAVAAALFFGYRKGRKAEENQQKAEQVEAIEEANEVKRDVDAEPDPVKRLRDKWQR